MTLIPNKTRAEAVSFNTYCQRCRSPAQLGSRRGATRELPSPARRLLDIGGGNGAQLRPSVGDTGRWRGSLRPDRHRRRAADHRGPPVLQVSAVCHRVDDPGDSPASGRLHTAVVRPDHADVRRVSAAAAAVLASPKSRTAGQPGGCDARSQDCRVKRGSRLWVKSGREFYGGNEQHVAGLTNRPTQDSPEAVVIGAG